MTDRTISTDILIIGGGAVGLFLGCRLAWLGIDFHIMEAQANRSGLSRSIGIHPPSLEYLERIGLAGRFLESGLKITDGLAIGDKGILGRLKFATCPGPYRFVMTLPQNQTEEILESHIRETTPGVLHRGCRAIGYKTTGSRISVTGKNLDGSTTVFDSRLVIGCDGKSSVVRQWMNIPFNGAAYSDTFLMGDFIDTTDFGSSAAIYFRKDGLIESFPLPKQKRRWVIRTKNFVENPTSVSLAGILQTRTCFNISASSDQPASAFGVQHYLTPVFGRGRMAVIGDAAHIVSPFGGQGMNLGWMDAWHLADLIHDKSLKSLTWNGFNRRRHIAAWQAIKRAEFNMWMGRAHRFPELNELLIKTLLVLPTRLILPRLFTMRWL